MPFMRNGKRDYQREYAWIKRTGGVKKIAKRVQARRDYIKEFGVHKARGKDIDHKNPLSKGGGGGIGNLRAVDPTTNRSFSRNADGSLKSQVSKKERE